MSKRNDFIWKAIQTVCWLIFVGYCIQAGTLLFNYIYSFFKPIATQNLHIGLDLSELYGKSQVIYTLVFTVIISISVLKGYVFYTVLNLFKTLNLVKPFSDKVSGYIQIITNYAFAIGIISFIARQLAHKLAGRGFDTGQAERYWNDGEAYLMMSAILFVIALIFKKGIELQQENDLTV
jgi:hypothetical protein